MVVTTRNRVSDVSPYSKSVDEGATLGLEIMSFGRPADAKFFDCELQLTGKHLLYTIRLDHDWLFFSVQLMDRAESERRLGRIERIDLSRHL